MSDIAIKVENISKKYQIGENKTYPTLRDKLMELPNRLFKGPKKIKEFWALKDVSFEVKKGEVVGIIGRNGAGKSTMLKILARITEPTSGKVTMYGRVASMLEVGTGFNPELTGRENIYLNGAIIGMTKREITQKFDEIVAFSGVEKFLDTPVKHYSSGMYVRLAFAVAAHLDADILLVDEVLAVGDAEFQKKCLGKMDDLAKSGRTVIFVSHNQSAIRELCTKCVYLKQGKIKTVAPSNVALTKYDNEGFDKENRSFSGPLKEIIKIDKIIINGSSKNYILIMPNQKITIVINGRCSKDLMNMRITVSLYTNNIRLLSMHDADKNVVLSKGKFISTYEIPENLLRPGSYDIYVGGHQNQNDSWFYSSAIKRFNIDRLWTKENDSENIGLINVKGKMARIKKTNNIL